MLVRPAGVFTTGGVTRLRAMLGELECDPVPCRISLDLSDTRLLSAAAVGLMVESEAIDVTAMSESVRAQLHLLGLAGRFGGCD